MSSINNDKTIKIFLKVRVIKILKNLKSLLKINIRVSIFFQN